MLRWPSRRNELKRVSEGPVLDLFEVYELASVAFVHWSNEPHSTAAAIAEDYRLILSEIEQDVAKHLAQGAMSNAR